MFKRFYVFLTALVVSAVAAPFAGATGFDVSDLTTQTRTTWGVAIATILGVVGVFLGAKVAIKWAMRLLAH